MELRNGEEGGDSRLSRREKEKKARDIPFIFYSLLSLLLALFIMSVTLAKKIVSK